MPPAHVHPEPHDLGLASDLATLTAQTIARRRALRWLLGGAAMLAGCGGGSDADAGSDDTGSSSNSGTTSGDTDGSCSVIPEETAGPYPADGSNSSNGSVANALLLSGIVRSDIRSSIAGASGTAEGVPLKVILELVDTGSGCADLAGYAIYLWHCDREGRYSMYSSGVTGENYLRGVQSSASDGTVTFETIFPACYSGRWPHIHFEIYRDTNSASDWSNKLRTSQLALPAEVCETVYAGADGYSASVANLAAVSLATDNVFSDGATTQLASVTGSLAEGYTARLVVGIAA